MVLFFKRSLDLDMCLEDTLQRIFLKV